RAAGDRARSAKRWQPHREEPGPFERWEDAVRELWVGDELLSGGGPYVGITGARSLSGARVPLRHLAVRRRKGEPNRDERHAVRHGHPQRRGADRCPQWSGLGDTARPRPAGAEL